MLDDVVNDDDDILSCGQGRAGNRGTATSFINDYNLRICKELVLVLNEAGQEVPKWLKSMAAREPEHSSPSQPHVCANCHVGNCHAGHVSVKFAQPSRAVAGGPAVQGLGFSKRSDREVDGFGEDEPEAQPETIAVHSAFGAPPAEDNDEDSMW